VSCRLSRPAQTGGARSGRGIRLLPEG
jgi:hypothetical protein